MGMADKQTVATQATVALSPVHEEQIPFPEPEVHVVQPNATLAHQMLEYLQTFFGGGAIPPGNQADVDPPDLQLHMAAPHPGPNQVVVQAPEPIPPLPPALGMVGFRRRARGCLAIAMLVIAISIRQGPGAVDAPRVASALGTGEGAVGANALALGAAATQIPVTLHVLRKPMVSGGPAVH